VWFHVQPVALLYGQRCGSGFDMCNTPSTRTGMWVLQLLCAPYHCLTVRYLAPVAPTPEFLQDPNAFAQHVQGQMATAMGPTVNATQQSYEEFFLYKLMCEELDLPAILLRSFDFKEAAESIAAAGGAELTMETAQATMYLFYEAYVATVYVVGNNVTGVTEYGVKAAMAEHTSLYLHQDTEEVWRSMASTEALSTATDELDYHQFLVALHAAATAEVGDSGGWFVEFCTSHARRNGRRGPPPGAAAEPAAAAVGKDLETGSGGGGSDAAGSGGGGGGVGSGDGGGVGGSGSDGDGDQAPLADQVGRGNGETTTKMESDAHATTEVADVQLGV